MTGLNIAQRLRPGEDLLNGLRALLRKAGARAMALATCAGSLTRVWIRHANCPEGTLYEGHFEVTSLVGTVDRAGQHIHITITDGNGSARGGHPLPGSAVYGTAEIVAVVLPALQFRREPCSLIGYDELVIESVEDVHGPAASPD
ncbi:PPC domain-containing DNA-binding protein [Paracoccus sp. (in: a-proteobacteria)]|uniref:PPC domain-containing DNA-binding protein n=1 Tax=Paracoccus sp. TaxID=267 RepID=UPI00396C4390